MPGVLEFPDQNGKPIAYCLVPAADRVGPNMLYRPGLPVTASPRLNASDTRFTDMFGRDINDAVPIREKDFWAPSPKLYTIEEWPCYPINFALFDSLPLPLIDSLLGQMTISRDPAKGIATYQVSWGGLPLTRSYVIEELGLGVAIWPRKALPRWQQFFMLFARGTSGIGPFNGSSSGLRIQPMTYGITKGRPVCGDTETLASSGSAMTRSMAMPRFVAMRTDGAAAPEHGILPVLCGSDGAFSIPDASTGRARSLVVLGEVPLREAAGDQATIARLSVDFGTTNTAIAIALGPRERVEVFPFSDELLARRLTKADPGFNLESRFIFFPMKTRPSNPLPTVVIETERGTDPFKGLYSLPTRTILCDRLDDQTIQAWVKSNFIKQDFKWDLNAGEPLRGAYLEMLARFIGFELRTRGNYQGVRRVEVVLTCPLSFTKDQTESMVRAQAVFVAALTECGFVVETRDHLVSESLANLYLIRSEKTGRGSELPEERHVVVDVGGGSTDISVFTGKGDPLFLDSLYLGGKDFSETVLANRLRSAGKGSALKTAIDGIFERELDDPAEKGFGRLLQMLLVRRLEDGIEQVAAGFASGALSGAPADFLTLLVFSAVYGVRMASLSGQINGRHIPAATEVRVWFVGLGSRLFELSPVEEMHLNRLASARKVLLDACRRVVPPGVKVSFDWGPRADAKLSVCRGALMVPREEPPLPLKTLFWADLPAAVPPIEWSHPFDVSKVGKIDDAMRATLSASELQACVLAAVKAVTSTLPLTASEDDVEKLLTDVRHGYSAGLGRIAQNPRDAPPHPVATAVNGLKDNVVGLMGP